jgi:hypothetical protein
MAARASNDSNLDDDNGQSDALIQQRIVSSSIQMIVANAAGKGGRAATGGETEVVENLQARSPGLPFRHAEVACTVLLGERYPRPMQLSCSSRTYWP